MPDGVCNLVRDVSTRRTNVSDGVGFEYEGDQSELKKVVGIRPHARPGLTNPGHFRRISQSPGSFSGDISCSSGIDKSRTFPADFPICLELFEAFFVPLTF
ncbi:Uncharacterized protein dnm_051300 [Desulfonema magnum]|uniref:Uncharacterized protein n=1 Tax=Desulfonema magnum TaxID=45655 RepID=A0A975GPP9_9BACT|nr:Uncharacterized protein dnm_051300 [Desulfonema magnum]